MSEIELYLKNIANRWRQELKAASTEVKLFSPYITLKLIEQIAEHYPQECEIHTLFSAEVFASGASSLETIRKIVTANQKVFHLPQLHAKLVLVPGQFASIGSQNLTRQGTKSKEASIALLTKVDIQNLEKLLQPWLQERRLITLEMIDHMEQLLPNITAAFSSFRKSALASDADVFSKQEERDLEAELRSALASRQARAALDARHRRRRDSLRDKLAVAPKSQAQAIGTVTEVTSHSSWGANSTRSLLVRQKDDLTSWNINGLQINLWKSNRYLLVDEKSGRLGWARVMKTRISFIGRAVNHGSFIEIDGVRMKIRTAGDWDKEPKYGRNICIDIRDTNETSIGVMSAWYSVGALEPIKFDPSEVSPLTSHHSKILTVIGKNFSKFLKACIPLIERPFVYKENLYGDSAATFFGSIGTHVRVRLATLRRHPVLIGTPL